jgi:hypothetical protein
MAHFVGLFGTIPVEGRVGDVKQNQSKFIPAKRCVAFPGHVAITRVYRFLVLWILRSGVIFAADSLNAIRF